MSNRKDEKLYLLLDSWSRMLARGRMESPLETGKIQMHIMDGQIDEVTSHEIIQIISFNRDEQPLKCRLVQHRNDRIVLEILEVLNAEIRHNLRVPVHFESFVYPLDGAWKGRRTIHSIDLSCGGIAFYGESGLRVDETLEIVIPVTEQPVIVRCKVLRVQELQNGRIFYAAKFVDMCDDEEKTLRRAVFSVQIKNGQERKQSFGAGAFGGLPANSSLE